MINKIRNTMKAKKGNGIFEFIIILAVIAIIITVTVPDINSKVKGKADTAVEKIDDIDESKGAADSE